MKISVFGNDYVGLVQAAVLAEVGHNILRVDVDQSKVGRLVQGLASIYGPGPDALLRESLDSGRLRFDNDACLVMEHGRMQFVAVGTPPDEDGAVDLGAIFAMADTIAEHRRKPVTVVKKSTVPAGTGDRLRTRIGRRLEADGRELEFEIVSSPEFFKGGPAVVDCRRSDRIVVGRDNEEVRQVMCGPYEPFSRNHDRMLFMDLYSTELTKYATSGMLATKIDFINQIAELAEHLGADVETVHQGISTDPRVGYHFIYPGRGHGGSCFPGGMCVLVHSVERAHCSSDLLQTVEVINRRQKHKLFERIRVLHDGDLRGKTFVLWGLAFKPNTGDMRDASSHELMETLWRHGARVRAYDPEAMQEAQRLYGHGERLGLMGTPETTLRGTDALIICAGWQQSKAPNFELLKEHLRAPVIFDGRNLCDPKRTTRYDFHYYSMGRGQSCPLPINKANLTQEDGTRLLRQI